LTNPHTRYPEDPNPAERQVFIESEKPKQQASSIGCFLFLSLLLVCGTLLACVWIIWGG
jgi:hypothetical protein